MSAPRDARGDREPVASPFSPRVAFVAALPPDLDGFALAPEEAALLGPRCAASRRESFALGRFAAARAIAALGAPTAPVLAGPIGEPCWPQGLAGSISHTAGIALAAVARRDEVPGLGIDIERRDRPVRLEIARRVCVGSERDWIDGGRDDADRRLRLMRLIAAKEATFKAFYPQAAVYLAFADAELVWDAEAAMFRGELRRDAGPRHLAGHRYAVRVIEPGDWIVAALELLE